MPRHAEAHFYDRVGWLRAAVLGANDGIVSIASLMLGVAAANASNAEVAIAGFAGLVGGALSMAAGEYVSVSAQRDTERADIARERRELAVAPERELEELTQLYERRGVEPELAREVAAQLTAHDALDAHLREELGMTRVAAARPWQASYASALSFGAGAAVPMLALILASGTPLMVAIGVLAIAFLGVMGALAARLGGAAVGRGALRVVAGGGLAMAVTTGVGELVGTVV